MEVGLKNETKVSRLGFVNKEFKSRKMSVLSLKKWMNLRKSV